MSRFPARSAVLYLCSFVVLACFADAANSARKLASNYRHWLEAEVPYIISSEERKDFLSLSTDEQRDSFIAAFWRARNPTPNSESNSYKEEHYRRLAYANEHFGVPAEESGWRTEMGRIYIVLGKPKQKAVYHEQANLRPIEIWFYEAQSPALPPYFYVMFYRHSGAEDWRLYSPITDGPAALVTTGRDQNDNTFALRLIRESAGDEVAKTACTLIPGERADFDHFEPTMESDMMLATINGLADNPLTKAALEANRLREHVTMSLLTGEAGRLSYAVVRDDQGRTTLSYLFQAAQPDARLVGQRGDGSFYYDMTLRTSVTTSDGKSVYDKEQPLSGKLTAPQAEVARKKRFGAEERLPLASGSYVVEVTLTNNINRVASRTRAAVSVPVVNLGELGISSLLAYAGSAAVPDPKGQLPFSYSRLRFTPRGSQTVDIRQGEKLPLLFQLWLGPKSSQVTDGDQVHLRYVFGAVTASHDSPAEERENIDVGNRDTGGNLLTGHTLDTSTLAPGSYRVVVGVTREADHRTAYAAMNLRVIPFSDFVDMWTAYGPADPEGTALDDLNRGMSAEAQGRDVEAQGFYARAAGATSVDMRPIERLAASLSRTGNNDALARLADQRILQSRAAGPETLLPIVHALRDRGNTKSAVKLLEAQIKLQPPSAELYRTLADACDASGDSGRARDLRALAAGVK